MNALVDESSKEVIEAIRLWCCSERYSGVLGEIGDRVRGGAKLQAKPLSGGLTNFSFKVFLEGHPEKAIFAKLSFSFALWNPDKSQHYDLARTENEFAMMQLASTLDHSIVANPYLCMDIEGGSKKLLLTEWRDNDLQLGSCFIDKDGLDLSIVPKIANVAASLNSLQVKDPEFNDAVRPYFFGAFGQFRDGLLRDSAVEPSSDKTLNRTQAYSQSIGHALATKLADAAFESFNARECLIHSDLHCFNILVQRRDEVDGSSRAGGSPVSVCDWEMSRVGPVGRDVGIIQAYPLACTIFHALSGNVSKIRDLLRFNELYWEEYASVARQKGKEEGFLAKAYRDGLGWCGWFIYLGYYIYDGQLDYMPFESKDSAEFKTLKDSVGTIGLKLLRLGFDEANQSLSIGNLKRMYEDIMTEEIELVLSSWAPSATLMNRGSLIAADDPASVKLACHLAANTMKQNHNQEGLSEYTVPVDSI